MKKKIRVNTKILKESSIKVGDKNYEQRLRRRVTDLRRVSQMAKEAAVKAEEAGNTELAKKLNDRVEEIEKLLATYNIDTIDPEEVESENTDKDELDKEGGEEDEDSEDTNKDEFEGEDKEGSDEEDQDDNSEIDDVDSTDDDDSLDNKEDNTKKDGPEKEDKDIPDGGDFDPKDDIEVEPTEDEKDPNKEEESEDDDSKEGGDWNPEEEKEDESEDETEEGGDWSPEGSEEDEKKDSDTDSEDIDDTKKDKSEKDDSEDDTEEGGDEDPEEDEDSNTETDKKSKGKKGSDGDEDSDDEEDDSDEEETDDSPVNDPFADEEDIPDLNLGGGMQEPRDATLKDIIKQLKGLSSEGKRGALAALQDIINSRKPTTESLTEAVKGVREMTDDEFGDYINSTYDLIDQVEVLDYEDEEELKKKKAKVGQWSTDPKTLKELEAEDDVALEKDFRKEKAREKENTKYAKVGTLDEFKLNFYNAIKHQVEMVIQEYQSYNEINAEYESEDVIMKADLTQEIPEEVIPVIDIYFDVSGSWDSEDIEIGKKAIATVKEFEDAGEIKLNIFYFSNGVSNTFESTRAIYGTGTHGWREVLKNIKATDAQNIMIMTDDDIEYLGSAKQGPTCRVDGCVWFLWKNGLASPSCVSHLIGRQGNYQYAFYR